MNDQIMVSVICNAYNHEKYIARTLDGFVMQQTDFPFEILVHDDASTDKTADIIREYEAKYPQLIKPIYQKENQYSKKLSVSREFQYPRVQGKYIAFCEGDDYWTDSRKLQKQVNALEAHPEADICAHRVAASRDEKIVRCYPGETDAHFTAEQVILGGGEFVGTNTLMFRTSLLGSRYDFIRMFSLDYVMQISGSLRGGMLYLGDCMSVYRQMTAGSWTARMKNDLSRRRKHSERLAGVLRAIDEETEHKYSETIAFVIGRTELKLLALEGKVKEILSRDRRKVLKKLPLKRRLGTVAMAIYRKVRPIKQ